MASAEVAVLSPANPEEDGPLKQYYEDLKFPIYTEVNVDPKMWVHSVEWKKVLAGDPVEIYPNDGYGMKVMTVDEWTSNWKRNGDLPDCLVCGSLRTREHHFLQDWCRGAKNWSSESLCLDCHGWSYRSYKDDAYLAPEDRDKLMWDKLLTQHDAHRVKRQSAWPQ